MYEYEPTMFHNKMLIVDQQMVSVGSTNFDLRSFQLNDEASLNVYDAGFADRMTEVFDARPQTRQGNTRTRRGRTVRSRKNSPNASSSR